MISRLLLSAFATAALAAPPAQVRFATFNASLNRASSGQLFLDLSNPAAGTTGVAQAKRIAEIIQRTNPDVLLINEFDHVAGGTAARLFTAVAAAGVNVRVIAQGSSEINIIIGVDEKDFPTTVQAIYHAFVK